jgi:hypothetical protein
MSAGIAPNSATAAAWGDRPPPRRLRVWKWVPVRGRKALAGFVSVELAIGLRLANLPVFRSGTNGPWVGAPGVPQLDQEKRQRRDDAGKPLFDAAFTWRDRATADLFSKAVLRLLLQKHPDSLDHGDGQRELPQ